MKKHLLKMCILITAAFFILGCVKNQSTISVYGTGTVLVKPDIAQMKILLGYTAKTTKAAQDEVNKMVRQAITVLKDAGIEDKNIMTASLTFRSEYDYYSGRRQLIGQRAEQGISFTVENIDNNSGKVSEIIDRLIQINGIELNQINFSVKDTTNYFIRARELAFEKAAEKANQYAELSQLKIKKVLSITEENNQYISPISNRFMNTGMDTLMAAQAADGSAIVPTGELEITSRIFVEFIMK